MVEHGTHKPKVVGSIPTPVTFLKFENKPEAYPPLEDKILGSWCSLVNTSPCHGEDRGFKSHRARQRARIDTKASFRAVFIGILSSSNPSLPFAIMNAMNIYFNDSFC